MPLRRNTDREREVESAMLAAASEALGLTSPAAAEPTAGQQCTPESTEDDSQKGVESGEPATEDVVEAPAGDEKTDEPASVEATVGETTSLGIRSDHGDGMTLFEHFKGFEARLARVEKQIADTKISNHRGLVRISDSARAMIAEADNPGGTSISKEARDFILAANSLLQRDDAEAAALLRRR